MAAGMAIFSIRFNGKTNRRTSKNYSREWFFSIGFDENFYGKDPKMAAGMAIFLSDVMKNFGEIQTCHTRWPFFNRIWWNFSRLQSKNDSRNCTFSIELDEKFRWNPKMPYAMALFRSHFIEFMRWKSKNGSRDGPFSIGFYGFFYGEIQKCQPDWPFFDQIWWKFSRWKSKNANGNGNSSFGCDEHNSVNSKNWQAEWPIFDQISWNFLQWNSKNCSRDGPFSIICAEQIQWNPKMLTGLALFDRILWNF